MTTQQAIQNIKYTGWMLKYDPKTFFEQVYGAFQVCHTCGKVFYHRGYYTEQNLCETCHEREVI